jgi:hypothetical protein
MKRLLLAVLAALAIPALSHADSPAQRAAISDELGRLAQSAASLAKTAAASDDRDIRKKFVAKATDLGDDLSALSRRARKDVALKVIMTDALAIDRDAFALIDMADDADDKAERRSLRGLATSLEAGVAGVKKAIETAAADDKDDKASKKGGARLPVITREGFAQLVAAVEEANTDADKVEIIRQAVTTNAFPVAHVAFLMDKIDTEAKKVDAAAFAWPNLVDPQNGFQLFAKLELEGSKAELRRRVGK